MILSEWFIRIDALVVAQNNPEKFLNEAFGNDPNTDRFISRIKDYGIVLFYKSVDIAYQKAMDEWLESKIKEFLERNKQNASE